MSENEDSEDIEFNGTLNRLTSIVREQYKTNLSKVIRENYSNWSSLEYGTVKTPAQSYIDKWTELYEQKAVNACMIAQFYRKEMLKFMNQIKQITKDGHLLSLKNNFALEITSPPRNSQVTSTTMDKSTQTSKDNRPSLSDRDISFLKEFRRSQRRSRKDFKTEPDEQIKKSPPKLKEIPVPVSSSPLMSPEKRIIDIFEDPFINEDNLEFHLNAMFNSQPSEEIIDISQASNIDLVQESLEVPISSEIHEDYDPEIKKILQDIDENNRLLKKRSEKEVSPKVPKLLPKEPKRENFRKKLMKSIWPCKLYHHRKRFQESLLIYSEKDPRNTDLIKQKFLELFGEDSDDEIGAFSPSHDMDSELLLSSSKKRVASMVVQNLMEPFKQGLIEDKATFKSMAQDFTECIIANDLYPSFIDVKQVIEGYFDDGDEDIDIKALLE